MKFLLEEVFRTEGVPEFTFVRPPNFGELLVDIRNPGKPVIVEGQSGTGKTTAVKKIIEESLPASGFEYLSARRSKDMPRILELANSAPKGNFIIDDFHRLGNDVQSKIADIIKVSAEEYGDNSHPKVVIIGINRVGSELIHLVHDIAKRCGIHRIVPASIETTTELIRKGEERLDVKFGDYSAIFAETKGDYWKPICDRYFYYNPETKVFAIEDPALFYYLRHLDWDAIRTACGFRAGTKEYLFDFAISFAGENRGLAKLIADQLDMFDCAVFYDEYFEANYLGKAWHKSFTEIFGEQSRFVVCLLDKHHVEKIWPTFERECFAPRVSEAAVIPIYLDDVPIPGIPKDIVGIPFKNHAALGADLANKVTDEIVYKLFERLEDA
jgi:hypothetical protein